MVAPSPAPPTGHAYRCIVLSPRPPARRKAIVTRLRTSRKADPGTSVGLAAHCATQHRCASPPRQRGGRGGRSRDSADPNLMTAFGAPVCEAIGIGLCRARARDAVPDLRQGRVLPRACGLRVVPTEAM